MFLIFLRQSGHLLTPSSLTRCDDRHYFNITILAIASSSNRPLQPARVQRGANKGAESCFHPARVQRGANKDHHFDTNIFHRFLTHFDHLDEYDVNEIDKSDVEV
ncbi:hypothetical protein RCL_jg19967.t1 [Rhizophagus clarus]|uniref:Uncharacterized protein n=1 Tax=Rhizophagus clarus TaxID=94130 RepID=A0A8H3LC84_9GLOM|nr:hypothetical protein RCL_jg19967.t1 [Rhizophagus clarus]